MLQDTASFQDGTAAGCQDFMDTRGSDKGYCVGDDETLPIPGVFGTSPFADGRGIDLIVRRSDMTVVFASNHGTPSGNENLTGADLLAEVQAAVADSQGN